jgi:hypothetical protein
MKTTRQIVMASLLFCVPIGNAQATEFCVKLNNYVDVFRLSSISSEDNALWFGEDVAFYGPGNHQGYAIPLVGSQAIVSSSPLLRFVALQGVNPSTAFGNHPNCTFNFFYGPPPLYINASCDGNTPGTWKKNNVQAQSVNCNVYIPPPAVPKVLGQAPSN